MQIDGVDVVVGKVTRIGYGVNNRLFRKPGGGGRSTEMLTVALGQSYYTDARAAQYDKYYQTSNGTAPSKFSPLSLQVRAWPATASTRSSGPSTTPRSTPSARCRPTPPWRCASG